MRLIKQEYCRVFTATDLPTDSDGLNEVDIHIQYLGQGDVRKAVALDNVIIPAILAAVNGAAEKPAGTLVDQAIAELENTSLINLRSICDKYDPGVIGEAARALEFRAVALTRIATYAESRATGGTHDQAAAEQNKVARQVRKALGYTIARADVTF